MVKSKALRTLEILCSILPTAFWVLILFSFEEPSLAITTLLCALIHESGHIICIFLMNEKKLSLRGAINGFRIKTNRVRSYNEEILIYLSGPFANLFASSLCFVMSIILDEAFLIGAIINLFTALSNLMPIRGYDGYGAIMAIMKKRESSDIALRALSCISSGLIFSLCLLSLYFINRYSGGYWIFAVFFVSMIKELKTGLEE